MSKTRKQVRAGSSEEGQMIALVKKAVNFWIEKKFSNKKACTEAAFDNFKDNSGIDPSSFTTIDCVAHHIGTLEKIYETGVYPASGRSRNIQTIIIEKVYPETYGKLEPKETKQITAEDVCELEQNEIPENYAEDQEDQETPKAKERMVDWNAIFYDCYLERELIEQSDEYTRTGQKVTLTIDHEKLMTFVNNRRRDENWGFLF